MLKVSYILFQNVKLSANKCSYTLEMMLLDTISLNVYIYKEWSFLQLVVSSRY